MKRKFTISDIAKMAGVSTSSVSCYFNNPQRVGAATAARIRSVVEKTGFRPSYRRPGPKSGERIGVKNGNILFLPLTTGSTAAFLTRPGISQFLGTLEEALRKHQMRLLFTGADCSRELADGCDGAILFGDSSDIGMLKHLGEELRNCPVIHCRERRSSTVAAWEHLSCDNGAVAPLAAGFLHKQGHRKVAAFSSDAGNPLYAERMKRFLSSARTHKLDVTPITVPADDPIPPGRRALRFRRLAGEFLRSNPGITGAYFTSDEALAGVWQLLRIGNRPLDLRYLVGSGNDSAALGALYPRPATVDTRLPEMALLAVEQLLEHFRSATGNSGTEIHLKPVLLPGDFEGP